MHNIKKTDSLLVDCKEVCLQLYTDTAKCMVASGEQNVGQDDNITAANNKSFKTVAKFTYWNDTNIAEFAFMKKLRTY
jgi:hypothetical protein